MSRKEERGVRKWEASIAVKKGNEETQREKRATVFGSVVY